MPTIRFMPADVTIECAEGDTVFDVGRRNGVAIDTSCVGKGTCGRCRVKILAGAEHLPPFNDVERRHLGNVYFITRVRLACQATVSDGDVTVEVPPPRKSPR